MLRRIGIIAVLSLIVAALAAVPAIAANPHFISASGSVDPDTGELLVSFKEAGLGDNQLITYTVDIGEATADYQCYNKPGNVPQADNKTVTETDAEFTVGTFSSGKNGQITRTNEDVEGTPLSQGDFRCPSGQRLFLDGVSYENVVLVSSSGDTIPLGDFSEPDLHIRVS